jgi:hypothetical protein
MWFRQTGGDRTGEKQELLLKKAAEQLSKG